MAFVALALERVEAGRLAVVEREVVAAAGAHEDLGAAVLVEEEDRRGRLELLHLAEQEVDQRGLTGTGLADHHGVGDRLLAERVLGRMGGVEIEVVRLTVGGLQGGGRNRPGLFSFLPVAKLWCGEKPRKFSELTLARRVRTSSCS